MHKGIFILILFLIGLAIVSWHENSLPQKAYVSTFHTSSQHSSFPEEKMPLETSGELEEDGSDEDGIPVDFYASQGSIPDNIHYLPVKLATGPLFHPDACTPPPRRA